jgi:hypothetical protein
MRAKITVKKAPRRRTRLRATGLSYGSDPYIQVVVILELGDRLPSPGPTGAAQLADRCFSNPPAWISYLDAGVSNREERIPVLGDWKQSPNRPRNRSQFLT